MSVVFHRTATHVLLISILGFPALPAVAQRPPAGSPPSSGSRGTTTSPPVVRPRTPTPQPEVAFISGKVAMDDGTLIPQNVVVERVCNGNVRQRTHTDAGGYFTFQVGSRLETVVDASSADVPGTFGSIQNADPNSDALRHSLMGCEVRANIAGFRSSSVDLARFDYWRSVDTGTIFLQRGDKVEGTTISVTSLQAPKDAKKAYGKAVEAAKKGKLDEAQKHLETAVAAYPQYAAAWFELGTVLRRENQTEAARKAYAQAIAAEPKFVPPYLPLALLAGQEGKWAEVLDITNRALELDPLNPFAYFYNGMANFNLANLTAAESSARRAERLDGQNRVPRVHLLLGMILAGKKAYSDAIGEMKAYLAVVPDAQDGEKVRAEVARLEELSRSSAQANANH